MAKIKVRTKTKDRITTVSAMIRHPMETGRRKDPETGVIIPIHHIQEVTCLLNDETVMTTVMGTGISKNPFIAFHIEDVDKGDILTLSWVDNLGESDSIKVVIE